MESSFDPLLNTKFRVSSNKDQLEKHGLFSTEWVVTNPLRPNCVTRGFYGLDSAANMFHTLRTMKLVAFRNWFS